MAVMRVNCPVDGDVYVREDDTCLVLTAGEPGGSLTYRCPKCQTWQLLLTRREPATVDLLLSTSCRVIHLEPEVPFRTPFPAGRWSPDDDEIREALEAWT